MQAASADRLAKDSPHPRKYVVQTEQCSRLRRVRWVKNRVLGVRVDGFSWLYATNNEVAAA